MRGGSGAVSGRLPVRGKVHYDVQNVGGGGVTLGGFLDVRGCVCCGGHPTCGTSDSGLFDPPGSACRWLSFITDRCCLGGGLVGAAESWLDALIIEHSPRGPRWLGHDLTALCEANRPGMTDVDGWDWALSLDYVLKCRQVAWVFLRRRADSGVHQHRL